MGIRVVIGTGSLEAQLPRGTVDTSPQSTYRALLFCRFLTRLTVTKIQDFECGSRSPSPQPEVFNIAIERFSDEQEEVRTTAAFATGKSNKIVQLLLTVRTTDQ